MTNTPAATAELQETDAIAVGTVEAARLLGVSRRYLVELIYQGEIKSSKLPSLRSGKPNVHRIKVSELKAFLDRHETPAA